MIACESVRVLFASGGAGPALEDASLSCDAGELVVVDGPSGSGKSTLLSLMAGLRRPTAGQVLADGQPVSRFTAHHRDQFRRRVGFLPQRLHLFEDLSALENALVPFLPRRAGPRAVDDARALLCELEVPVDRAVRALSGGEQQRAALARALVTSPPFVLLDEPTAHQDPGRVQLVASILERQRARGAAVVVAAHDERLASLLTVARRYTLASGRLREASA